MNVLIACEDFRVGGAQVFCLNLGKALGKNHNVYLYSQYRDYVDSELVRQHYPKARIIVPDIPLDKAVRKLDRLLYKLDIDWSLRDHFVIRHMRKTISNLNVQLVHSNMFKSDHLFCRAMKEYPVPLVITMHGNYETFLDNIREAKGEKILNYMQKVGDVVKRIDALVYLTTKNLRVLGELDSKSMLPSTSFVKRKIYNGFSHNSTKSVFDRRQKLGISGHHTVFGLVARGIPEKGWESAIRAFLAMDDNKNAALILVGDSSYLDTLKREFSQQRNIHFVGYSSNPLKWINCFDMGLLPTVYGESLPTSIIEYLSCGKPVIATGIGEIEEMLSVNGDMAGRIVEVRNGEADHHALVRLMEYFHRNPAKRQSLSRMALEASEKFSMDRCVRSYERMYKDLLSSSNGIRVSNGRKPKKKNVLLIIPELGSGGAERSISKLSQLLTRHHNVYLCVNNSENKSPYPFGGTLINLGLPQSNNIFHKSLLWYRRIHLIRKMKREVSIDTSISFLEGANYLNVLARGKDRVVLTVRGSLRGDRTIRGVVGFIRKKLLIPQLFRRGDQVIAVSDALKKEMMVSFHIPSIRIVTIQNSYHIEDVRSKSKEKIEGPLNFIFDEPVIIAAGRFHIQKNFESLITVFGSVLKQISCRLVILGDGVLRGSYVQHARMLGLKVCDLITESKVREADVFILGYRKNPFKFFAKANLFVLSSSWEGFPNSLVEAMICGVPVISSDCPTGPREILAPDTQSSSQLTEAEDTPYGTLLPVLGDEPEKHDVSIWKNVITSYLSDSEMARQKSMRAWQKVKEFDIKYARQRWEAIL